MELRRYSYVDVYYNRGEGKKARKEQKRLEGIGYELQTRDSGGGHDKKTGRGFDFCDQYLKHHKTTITHLKKKRRCSNS